MYTIKDYQQKLNKTIDIQKALVLWQSYSNDMYKLYEPYLINKEVLIVGAGHLTDFPMKKIINKVSNISLYDIDKEAMLLGLQTQDINKKNVPCITKDLTNLDDAGFFKQVVTLLQANDLEGIKRFFRIVSHMNLNLDINHKFDLLIISPFYTQLLLPQYLTYLNEFVKGSQFNEYLEPLLLLISKFIDKINEQLLSCLNSNGKLIVMSDHLEFKLDDPNYLKIRKDNNQLTIDKYYENYLSKYGHGLGSYGLENLVEKTKLTHKSWHWWPFNENKVLLVKMGIMEKMKVEENEV